MILGRLNSSSRQMGEELYTYEFINNFSEKLSTMIISCVCGNDLACCILMYSFLVNCY